MLLKPGVSEIQIVQVASMNQISILSDQELDALFLWPPSDNFLAKRFVAKTALFRCLSQIDIPFDDCTAVSIVHDSYGKPFFSFPQSLSDLLRHHGVKSVLLSIADEKCSACAYVVLNFE